MWIGMNLHHEIYQTAVMEGIQGLKWLTEEQMQTLQSCNDREGYGVMLWEDGSRFEGNWEKGKPNGSGISWTASGIKYNGTWRNGRLNGKGKYTTANGAIYKGEWKMNKREGNGWELSANGTTYEG